MKRPAHVLRLNRVAQFARAVLPGRIPDWTHAVPLGGMPRWGYVMRLSRGLRGAHNALAVTRGGRCGRRFDVARLASGICAKKCLAKVGAGCSGGTAESGGGVLRPASRSSVDRSGYRRVTAVRNARNVPLSEERQRRRVRLSCGEPAIEIRDRRWRADRASGLVEIQTQMGRSVTMRVGRHRAQGWKKRVRVERMVAPPFESERDWHRSPGKHRGPNARRWEWGVRQRAVQVPPFGPERDWHRWTGTHRKFRARGPEKRVPLEGVRTLPSDQERVRRRWSGDHRGSSARHVLRLRAGLVLRISHGILCGDWRCG